MKILPLLPVLFAAFLLSASGAEMKITTVPVVPAAPKVTASGRPIPFHGKVDSVDLAARTFTMRTKAGKDHVFHITAATKMLKNETAVATLADVKAQDQVRGSRRKLGEGDWDAVTVIIGAKPAVAK